MLVQPAVVPDGTPIKEETEAAVQSIHVGRAGRTSGMRAEHLKMWLIEATREKNLDKARWEGLVSMAQLNFQEGIISAELIWTTMILLPKGKGEYRGISLVEVIWKMISTIINIRLRMFILIHDSLHGSRQGRRADMVTVEDKLSQHPFGI